MRNALPTISSLLLAHVLSAQGRTDYLNVETPQVKPIAVARIDGHDYILACNTPDNSVEIWDTDETIVPESSRFLLRIPVGLEPGSVIFSAVTNCFYTTDFLSDSVTAVQLTASGSPAAPLTFEVRAMRNVGDEPVHLALAFGDTKLVVAFMSSHSVAVFDAATLAPTAPVISTHVDSGVPTPGGPNEVWALREPRTVVVDGSSAYVIGHKGGHRAIGANNYDYDLAKIDLVTGLTTAWTGNLGTTNSNLALGGDGKLYVVGGLARNELPATAFAASAPSGFVESRLYVLDASLAAASLQTHDLNVLPSGAVRPPTSSCSQPADVMPFAVGGVGGKVFVASLGTDRIAVVRPTNQPPATWVTDTIDLAPPSAPLEWGPRAFAYKQRTTTLGHRIYFLNRLGNAIGILNPITESVLAMVPLHNDPTPAYVRDGRPFLYSAKLSANGFVACASCHTDGRTDSLRWRLGSPTGFSAAFPPEFPDSPARTGPGELSDLVLHGFDPDKGPLVTQSLQGLLNYEIEPDTQSYTSNAPYHWRGDRSTFTVFNEAFTGLLGLPNLSPPNTPPTGIPTAGMSAFEEFVNSIHYPPNPHQLATREFGAGATNGLDAFHTVGIGGSVGGCNNRSCVQCHWLPEGSGNRMTESDGEVLETAALRGLLQKNATLDLNHTSVGSVRLGSLADSAGMAHDATHASVNGFITDTFSGNFSAGDLDDIRAFVREMDWGTAPIVGRIRTLHLGDGDGEVVSMEAEAKKANAGVVAFAQLVVGGAIVRRNWVYYVTRDLYVEQVTSGTADARTRSNLLALLGTSQDSLVFCSTPLGSERRIASPAGTATAQPPLTPANLSFQPMRPNTAYRGVPLLTGNWSPLDPVAPFVFTHQSLPTPPALHAIRLLQHALKTGTPVGGPAQDFGLAGLRHDAPRRFRVAGSQLLLGAVLWIRTPDDTVPPVLSQAANPTKTRLLRIPIHPSGETADGVPIWESAVEFDPMTYYLMMVGGPRAQGVPEILEDLNSTIVEPPLGAPPWRAPSGPAVAPDLFNWHYVSVQNPGQPEVVIGWRRVVLD
ncbi:MAG TPA: hypothetical protein VFZ65_12975 [Planctomycetota bacterium]|nr:hypothetical protein [Planctomycetota bacterium]